MVRSTGGKSQTNMNLGKFKFDIDNVDMKENNSQPVKLSLRGSNEEIKVSNFIDTSEYSDLSGIKRMSLNDGEEIKNQVKLSPKKSSILNFMERKLSNDDAFFSLNK
jgi:methyl coenzyme M reductase subunit C-like uncharacterized protein (methanogenesis marker protein 7)